MEKKRQICTVLDNKQTFPHFLLLPVTSPLLTRNTKEHLNDELKHNRDAFFRQARRYFSRQQPVTCAWTPSPPLWTTLRTETLEPRRPSVYQVNLIGIPARPDLTLTPSPDPLTHIHAKKSPAPDLDWPEWINGLISRISRHNESPPSRSTSPHKSPHLTFVVVIVVLLVLRVHHLKGLVCKCRHLQPAPCDPKPTPLCVNFTKYCCVKSRFFCRFMILNNFFPEFCYTSLRVKLRLVCVMPP